MQERPPETRMITDMPEAREYRALYSRVLDVVRAYNGTEQAYNAITKLLITLEEKALTLGFFPPSSKQPIPDQERITADIALPHQESIPRDIAGLLDTAATAESVRRVIHAALRGGGQAMEHSPLFIRHIAGVLLQPDTQPRVIHGDGEFDPVRFEERLFEIITLLGREHIFIEDCGVTIGQLLPNQMRQLSYALVEIPRIRRSVLVCDQVGEATFVIHGLGDSRRYLSMTKKDLEQMLGTNVRRVIRHNPGQWLAELGILLFTEEGWLSHSQNAPQSPRDLSPRPKIDVPQFFAVREAIFQSAFNTIGDWVKMSVRDAREFTLPALADVRLGVIAKWLGIDGNPFSQRLCRLEIARAFFGDDPLLITEIEKERVRLERKEQSVSAPPGWRVRKALAKEIGVGPQTLEKKLTTYLSEHPEWEHEYLDTGGRIVPHLSQELCDIMRQEFKELSEKMRYAEKAPPDWLTRSALAKEIGVTWRGLEKELTPYLSVHPDWEHEYLDVSGKLIPFLSPALCTVIRTSRNT